jgi:cation transporter-like permease
MKEGPHISCPRELRVFKEMARALQLLQICVLWEVAQGMLLGSMQSQRIRLCS